MSNKKQHKKMEVALTPGTFVVDPGDKKSPLKEIKTGYPHIFKDGEKDRPFLAEEKPYWG